MPCGAFAVVLSQVPETGPGAPMIGGQPNDKSLVRATNFQLFGFDMILCRRSRWAVTSSMAACTRVSMPCASVR